MIRNQSELRAAASRASLEEWEMLRRDAIARARRLRSQMALDLARSLWRATGAALAALATGAARFARGLADRQRDRIAIAKLHALDDTALCDIGIRRSEIESIVHARGNDNTRLRKAEKLAA